MVTHLYVGEPSRMRHMNLSAHWRFFLQHLLTANHVGCNPFVRTASCSLGCPGAAVWGCAGVRDAYCTAFFEEGTCSASSIYDSHLESYTKPFICMARPTWRTCRRRRYGVAYAMHRSGDWLSLEYVSRISCAAKTAKKCSAYFLCVPTNFRYLRTFTVSHVLEFLSVTPFTNWRWHKLTRIVAELRGVLRTMAANIDWHWRSVATLT